MKRSIVRRCERIAAAIVIIAGTLAASAMVLAQDRGVAPPKDTIFARKILMDTINNNMDEIEAMIGSGKLDLAEAREHADTISVMLMAFPHLFPDGTNQWKPNVPRDAGTDTYASPDVWTSYRDFYRKAADASKVAFRAARVKQEAEFKALIGELRAACNGCHMAYQKSE